MNIAEDNAKVYTISLPGELAARAELLAERDHQTMSEVLAEALRAYSKRAFLEDIRRYAATRNPHGYTEDDIPRLIREVREEMAAEQQ